MDERSAAYGTLKTTLFALVHDLGDLAFVLRLFAAGAEAGGEDEIANDVARIAVAVARPEGSEEGVGDWVDVAAALYEEWADMELVGRLLAAMATCLEALGAATATAARDASVMASESPRARADAARRELIDRHAEELDELLASGFLKPGRFGQVKVGPAEWAAWDREKAARRGPQPGDTLRVMPPPPSSPEPLTASEIRRVLELARVRSGRFGRRADSARRALALFAAEVLPRFKSAEHKRQPSVPLHVRAWMAAAQLATKPREFSWSTLFDALELFEEVTPTGTFGGKWFPATWRIKAGAFVFDAGAPPEHLHRRTRRKESGDLEVRWRLLEAAAQTNGGEEATSPP